MNDEMIVRAIRRLKPTAQFTFTDCDYSTIKWDVLDGDAPTLKEITDAIKANDADDKAQAESRAAAKLTAHAKLAALGLTVEDLTALGL